MKTLQELLALLPDSSKNYYCSEINTFSSDDKAKLVELGNRLYKAGCKNPIAWAFSEITDGVPQFARFVVLKNLFDIISDTDGVVVEAELFDEDIQQKISIVKEVLGEENYRKMMCAYSRGIISGVISMLDQGNYAAKSDKISWQLTEVDENETHTGKQITGLHEDFYDFDECIS